MIKISDENKTLLRLLDENDFSHYTVHDVRDLARVLGVASPTSKKKEENIESINKILNDELSPSDERRGRTDKGDGEQDILVKWVDYCKGKLIQDTKNPINGLCEKPLELQNYSTRDTDDDNFDNNNEKMNFNDIADLEVEGVLETSLQGFGFLRVDNYFTSNNDVYVNQKYITKYRLRTGDWVKGKAKQFENSKSITLIYITEINNVETSNFGNRPNFEDLKAVFPKERIKLETTTSKLDFALREIDLVSPIGRGQRGLIVSPPKAGKTVLLKKIAKAITANYPDIHLMLVLIDERPEEVTDMEQDVQNCEIIASTFDQNPSHHTKVAELALKRAKRLVEMNQHVVILMDSITRLARAYNNVVEPSGRTLSGGLDVASLYEPKRFFGAARNTIEAGSLTIIATALIDTGSKMDDIIYEEFKGTGNMEIHLDRKLSEKRVFPAIDLERSGTRREDLLYTDKELSGMWAVRKLLSRTDVSDSAEILLDMLTKSSNNDEFLLKLEDTMRKK